jgi:hypothetical protein
MRHLTRILPVAIVALVLPATAWATGGATVAPPGQSGIAQYLEVVPSAAGARPPGAGGGNGGAGAAQGGALTDTQRHRLDGLGPDGRSLAAVIDATAPQQAAPAAATGTASPSGRPEAPGAYASGSSGGRPLSSGSSGSPASLLLDAVGGHDGGGLGPSLPAFMLVSALGVAGAYAVRRRRMH